MGVACQWDVSVLICSCRILYFLTMECLVNITGGYFSWRLRDLKDESICCGVLKACLKVLMNAGFRASQSGLWTVSQLLTGMFRGFLCPVTVLGCGYVLAVFIFLLCLSKKKEKNHSKTTFRCFITFGKESSCRFDVFTALCLHHPVVKSSGLPQQWGSIASILKANPQVMTSWISEVHSRLLFPMLRTHCAILYPAWQPLHSPPPL